MADNSLQNLTFLPSQNQIKFVDLYLDFDKRRTLEQIAEGIGITRQAVWLWFQDDRFVEWLNNKIEELLKASRMARITTAVRKAKNGDFNFSKMLFEVEKFYTPAISHNISIKITEIVIKHVIEVIDKYIEDENLRHKIGEELTSIHLN